MSDDIQKAGVTLTCTRCGHAVPDPADSTSDDTLVICPACGTSFGRWGEVRNETGAAAAKAVMDEIFKPE
jgi:DNA-directed RNA polymerase subunit RPC12/RpoP